MHEARIRLIFTNLPIDFPDDNRNNHFVNASVVLYHYIFTIATNMITDQVDIEKPWEKFQNNLMEIDADEFECIYKEDIYASHIKAVSSEK